MAKFPFKKGQEVVFNAAMEEIHEGKIKAGSRGVVIKRTTISNRPNLVMVHYRHESGEIIFDFGGVGAEIA